MILLETCALLMMNPTALMNLFAAGGINTFLFNVSITIMLPYFLMLREIMNFMMWNKLKNLLFSRVPMKLLVIFKMMMLLLKPKIMLYLVIALNITMIILISLNFLRKIILQKNLLPFRNLWEKALRRLKPHWTKRRRGVKMKVTL